MRMRCQHWKSSVYDWLGVMPASTLASTDTKAAANMNALSRNSPETPMYSLSDSCPNLQIQILAVRSVETIPPFTKLKDLVSATVETIFECVSQD